MMTDVIDFGLPILHGILIIIVWIFEGFALKFVDQVVDEGKKPPKSVLVAVIIIAGLFAGFSMAIDTVTTAMVLALITGVILGGKIDNIDYGINIQGSVNMGEQLLASLQILVFDFRFYFLSLDAK